MSLKTRTWHVYALRKTRQLDFQPVVCAKVRESDLELQTLPPEKLVASHQTISAGAA
jgi:hypothetical protein